MGKIRVLHFELDKNIGGIETFLLNLYTQIDRNEVQFEFVTAVENPALGDRLEKLGGIIHRVSPHSNPFAYKKDISKLLENNYDVIHVHKNSAANIIPLELAEKSGAKKIIVHSHNTAPSMGKASVLLHKMNRKKLCKIADYKFACSTEAGKWLFGGDEFTLIKNGIITSRFLYDEKIAAEKRKELGVPENAVLFGHVGRFTDQKNHTFLLDIFSEILKKKPESTLLLVGDGEHKSDCENKARALKISDKVIFAGVREDIPDLMKAMDAFIMPSLYEGLPIVGIEAQAAGLPLFLSDTVSPETELCGSVKWFSINDSADEIADIILSETLSDTDTRIKRNSEIAKKGYDIKTTADYILNCYKE